jgi:excinuclease ABC subunit C
MINNLIQEQLDLLPRSSGVYKFFNENNEILYVGKAHNLKSRVSSYFTDTHEDRPRIIGMIPLIKNIQTIQTENDIEALVLESALIKEYQPKYNSDAKDDKSYAYLYINIKDEYPTVSIIRNITKEEYKNGKVFGPYPKGSAIKRVYRYLRTIYPFCTSKDPTKVCFDVQIGLCPGPIGHEEYMKNINGIISFLNGKNRDIIKSFEIQMKELSNAKEYEKAAIIRDKIEDLKYLSYKIEGNILNSEETYVQTKQRRSLDTVQKLAKEIGVEKLNRIECYDISNIQGTNAYGSMTVAINGTLDSSMYRIFKIKGENTPDDFRMLNEVIQRRMTHIANDLDKSLNTKPDLILIDGGKGQISAVQDSIKDVTVMGITKGRKYKRKGGNLKDEFLKVGENGEIENIRIRNSRILSTLRDEAHRFAILHHRKARSKSQIKSYLDEIPNVGPKTKKILKKIFVTKDSMLNASYENLYELVKNKKIVNSLIQYITDLKSKA